MKTRFSSYKLPVDHLEQAAKEIVACSLVVVQKKEELTAAEAERAKAEQRLIALLRETKRKSVTADKVKYTLVKTGTELLGTEAWELKKELVLS